MQKKRFACIFQQLTGQADGRADLKSLDWLPATVLLNFDLHGYVIVLFLPFLVSSCPWALGKIQPMFPVECTLMGQCCCWVPRRPPVCRLDQGTMHGVLCDEGHATSTFPQLFRENSLHSQFALRFQALSFLQAMLTNMWNRRKSTEPMHLKKVIINTQ